MPTYITSYIGINYHVIIDNFLPEFGIHDHTLRNDLIRLPAIRCEFGEMNAKYQMHLRLRELVSPPYNTAYPPIQISEATLVSGYINSLFFKLFNDSVCEIIL